MGCMIKHLHQNRKTNYYLSKTTITKNTFSFPVISSLDGSKSGITIRRSESLIIENNVLTNCTIGSSINDYSVFLKIFTIPSRITVDKIITAPM